MAAVGGPIRTIETCKVEIAGRPLFQANAFLKPGCTPQQRLSLYNAAADGTGTHPDAMIARHMAISEALERWAFHATVHSDRAADYAFDVDPSSTGMAAFPGLFAGEARRRARLEAIERYSLLAWWQGTLKGSLIDTDWPNVKAVVIPAPVGGITAIVFSRTAAGYAYGHAADEAVGVAIEKALIELERRQRVLKNWHALPAALRPKATNVLEAQSLFFASEEGFETFRARIHTRPAGDPPPFEVLCDAEIVGPWTEFATVWRVAVRPPSTDHLVSAKCFFA